MRGFTICTLNHRIISMSKKGRLVGEDTHERGTHKKLVKETPKERGL
jgi:hypothetical protein